MDIADVMDALAAVTFTSVRLTGAYGWPQSTVVPPAWVVGYPEGIDYDLTFMRGADTQTFPCWYVVGAADSKSARDAISAVIGGTSDMKVAIEADTTLNGGQSAVAQSTRVVKCTPTTIDIGAVSLMAARFDVEVIG